MTYVDGFVIPVPKDKVNDYLKIAEKAGDIWKEYGALDYVEAEIDHDNIQGLRSFADTANADENETVFFSYITYKSREHRDEVNAKVMADPRIKEQCGDVMPFDCKRMAYAGFKMRVCK